MMVASEVARDPPSPFLTVQAGCEGVVLPAVTPPAAAASAACTPFGSVCNGHSSSWQQQQEQSAQLQQKQAQQQAPQAKGSPAAVFRRRSAGGEALQRSNLQSIVSQQSLNFDVVPPDSPLEFELALSSIAAATGGPAEQAKHQQLVEAATAAAASSGYQNGAKAAVNVPMGDRAADADALQAAGSWKPKGLRFLPLSQGWLRHSQSLPQCSSCGRSGGSGGGAHSKQQQQQLMHLPPSLHGHMQGIGNSPLGGVAEQSVPLCNHHHHQQHLMGHKLKCKVHKLLSWASSGRQGQLAAASAAIANSHAGTPIPVCRGGVVLVDAASVSSSLSQQTSQQTPHQQQQQQRHVPVPVPWQHQLFTEPSTSAGGVQQPLRSPRTSLVSSPSSCDCPIYQGRFSSAGGSDSSYGGSPGPVGPTLNSLPSSLSCSMASSPSPAKMEAAAGRESPAGGALMVTTSLRPVHYRHRQHRPGCRHYQEQQQAQQVQQQQAQQAQQVQLQGAIGSQCGSCLQHQSQPVSPLGGPLQPQSSLRTALHQLESMASFKAARIMEKLNAGLLKMTSHRVFDGVVIKGCAVGKEVLRDWEFGPPLGMGASSVTRLVTERNTGRHAACKTISKQGILRSAAVKAALLGVQREVAILQASVGHTNVVQLHAVYEDAHNLHMILEWCGGGSLFSLMERCPGLKLPEQAAAAATRATLEVLAHCHGRGVMHRDIKPDNLLITEPLDDPLQLTIDHIKVSDFGISLPVTPGQMLDEMAGTPGYIAPEVFQRCYDQQADVWSTGVMLYEMITGRLPFPGGNTLEEFLMGIESTELDLCCPEWQAVGEQGRQLVAAMLNKDPQLRPSPHKLLQTFSTWLHQGSKQL